MRKGGLFLAIMLLEDALRWKNMRKSIVDSSRITIQ